MVFEYYYYNSDINSCLTSLIGDEIKETMRWSTFVDGGDGFLYGIPDHASRVIKFNPLDKSFTEIGPDLGLTEIGPFGSKWMCGVLANNRCIYCAPGLGADHILKIDTIRGTVETLDDIELPETGTCWLSGALASDNNIYYVPFQGTRIMKFNPHFNILSSVGDDLGLAQPYGTERGGYRGAVIGIDKCLYGIPGDSAYPTLRIFKFDLDNPDTTSTVGKELKVGCGNGVLCGDGFIYAANDDGQVLQIDTTNNNYTIIGDPIHTEWERGWGDPIVGVDQWIYWPPLNANHVLAYDPMTPQKRPLQEWPLLMGDDLGEGHYKYLGGALATDDVIYCIPYWTTEEQSYLPFCPRVLAIDPLKEISNILKYNFKQNPHMKLGDLFLKPHMCNETVYEHLLRLFDTEKVFQLFEECFPTDGEWLGTPPDSNALPLFMIAASCENSSVSLIYYFLRRNNLMWNR